MVRAETFGAYNNSIIHLFAGIGRSDDNRAGCPATRINDRFDIDGVLDEGPGQWEDRSLTSFNILNEGKPASEPTKVIVLYDDAALYIGFMCYESRPEKWSGLWGKGQRGGGRRGSDEIDSYHDHLTSFFFEVNVSGTLRDGYRFGVGQLRHDLELGVGSRNLDRPRGMERGIPDSLQLPSF
jgi:hypothetical protein